MDGLTRRDRVRPFVKAVQSWAHRMAHVNAVYLDESYAPIMLALVNPSHCSL
jgi:hypothetical protein